MQSCSKVLLFFFPGAHEVTEAQQAAFALHNPHSFSFSLRNSIADASEWKWRCCSSLLLAEVGAFFAFFVVVLVSEEAFFLMELALGEVFLERLVVEGFFGGAFLAVVLPFLTAVLFLVDFVVFGLFLAAAIVVGVLF